MNRIFNNKNSSNPSHGPVDDEAQEKRKGRNNSPVSKNSCVDKLQNCLRKFSSASTNGSSGSILNKIHKDLGSASSNRGEKNPILPSSFPSSIAEILKDVDIGRSKEGFFQRLKGSLEKLLLSYRKLPKQVLSLIVFVMLVCIKILMLVIWVLNFIVMPLTIRVVTSCILSLLVTVLWIFVRESKITYYTWRFSCVSLELRPDPSDNEVAMISMRLSSSLHQKEKWFSEARDGLEEFGHQFCERIEYVDDKDTNFFLKAKQRIKQKFNNLTKH